MLLGFKPRFIEPILEGTKVFTMRSPRKVTPKIGETLYMYTGLRTKNCKLITKKFALARIQHVCIHINKKRNGSSVKVIVDDGFVEGISDNVLGKAITGKRLQEFFKYDGFADKNDFVNYWLPQRKGMLWVNLDLFHWTSLKY